MFFGNKIKKKTEGKANLVIVRKSKLYKLMIDIDFKILLWNYEIFSDKFILQCWENNIKILGINKGYIWINVNLIN